MNYRGNHDCHLLLCLPWDNWTLPERELGWSEIVKIIIILVMIIITIMIITMIIFQIMTIMLTHLMWRNWFLSTS